MKNIFFVTCLVVALGLPIIAQAELVDHGNGFIYDTVQNITWYDAPRVTRNQPDSVLWATNLSVTDVNGVSITGWRLPSTMATGGGAVIDSEMADLYYNGLGNTYANFVNSGPFVNLIPNDITLPNLNYWTGNLLDGNPSVAWDYHFQHGFQHSDPKGNLFYALAVHDGKIGEPIDTDSDGTLDCNDNCPNDPNKIEAGECGCGIADIDTDADGVLDCNDNSSPAGTMSINNGDTYTTSQTVTLTLDALGADSMCFSNDNLNYTAWEPYGATKNWSLLDGDGQKTVYVKFKNNAGNISTTSYEILYDGTPPDAPILSGLGTTDDNQPLLDWEVVATTMEYELEYGVQNDMASADQVFGIGPSEYGMPSPLADGTWYWRVRAVDDYGNVGAWSIIGAFTIDTSENCETSVSIPVLLSPANNAVDVSLEPTLTTSDFNDGGNCSGHWKTHWKINDRADDFNGATTFNYVSMDHSMKETGNSNQKKGSLTSLEVPAMILDPGKTYYWRVRYHGDRGNKSEWSEVYSFTTQSDPDDQDNNGIPDDNELDDDTDLNEDSIPDKEQTGSMTSVKSKKGGKKIGIETNACVISRVCVIDEQEIVDDDGKPDQMPYGLIGYKFEPAHYGETVSVKVHLSEPAPAGAKWVFYDKISGWQDYSGYASFNQARDEITLELKDGGFGDEDHTENKCIIDPGGIGIYNSDGATSSSGGSGGCFINTMLK